MSLIPKNAFGLDISDASIEALEIRKRLGKFTISAYSRIELKSGIVENGKILDKEKLVAAIRTLLDTAKPNPLKSKNVILSIPESKTFIHTFQLPAVISEENIGESVQYAAAEIIPLSFDQVYHDYRVIIKEKDYQEVFYIACMKEILDDYREVVAKAGLNAVAFEAESLALARALAMDDMFEGVLIVDLGARTTIITIYDHQGIRYSKNIPLAGNHFTEKIARSLKIPLEQAENIKKEVGLTQQTNKGKSGFSLESLAQGIVKEINKAINYHQKKTGFVINEVVLCGGTSLMPGLMGYMHSALKIRVELGNPLVGLHYSRKTFVVEQALLFSTVVGLALRGINNKPAQSDINLLRYEKDHQKPVSREFKSKSKVKKRTEEVTTISAPRRKRLKILIGVFIFLIIAFVGLYFWQKDKQGPLISFQSTDYQNQSQVSQVETRAIKVQADLYVYTTSQEELPTGAIAGRLLEKTLTQTKEFDSTGKKSVGGSATGTITIINNYSVDQPLVATTRFLTSDGVLFRLKEYTLVPANSSVEAEIYADQPGPQGDVKPTKMTIPGLSTSLQQYIYGELKNPTSGGSGEASYVLETDIQQALEEIQDESSAFELSAFEAELQDGEILFSEILSNQVSDPSFSAEIGQITETFTASWEISSVALALKKDDLVQKLNEQLISKIPPDRSTDDYQLTNWQYSLQEFDQANNLVKIQITAEARLS